MKINFLVMVVLLFVSNTTIAQKSRKNRNQKRAQSGERVKVYMDNGAIFNGIKVSETEDSLTIRAFQDNLISLAKNDADRILDADEALVFANGKYYDSNGFFWGIAISANPLRLADSESAFSNTRLSHIESYYGWRFNNRLSLSSGVAIEYNEARLGGFEIDTQFFTFFGQAHYNLSNTKFRLYSFARLGYGLSSGNGFLFTSHDNGAQFQLGGGFRIPSRKRSKINIGFAWHFQQTDGTEIYFDNFGNQVTTEFNLYISRPVLKIVYEFN